MQDKNLNSGLMGKIALENFFCCIFGTFLNYCVDLTFVENIMILATLKRIQINGG